MRQESDREAMFGLLQEAGARFGVVVTWVGVRRLLPELWRAIDEHMAEHQLNKKNLFLYRSITNSQREEHSEELVRFSSKLDELRQENETLRQRLSTYEPGEVQS